ncbi:MULTISPECIES: hydantoinase/oxoprolinase family protein [unclassified Beijerinckia]|uniref:hydantoinase/oxoprolinase family protein n=1 Tax=unclassified Beijerinckia TaxID=2638183 RepID=UPI00089D8AC9|nr:MULTISPECIES: hydantoinase/oxoprolinase family protein [unclassified Beijerinckia]MDH7799219.1 N-methylhydantoinase A [Beijerinckia sp. GAS462]SED91624.1 N-methylhydantoinase A [Beijerinckia sp. 28-YEA-48]
MLDRAQKYLVATDVGGTCTDTVVFAAGEPVHIGKALSTPPNFAAGVLDSIRSACDVMNVSLEELLSQTKLFVHGSTVVDNTVFTRDGSKIGLITTKGFEDTILITRGAYGRWGGLTEDRLKHPVKTSRAAPLVAPDCIVGVGERVDYKGAILLDLDPKEAERAVRFLVEEKGVDAIAVSFLWSFFNSRNEEVLRQAVERVAPGVYCTLSSQVAPTPGEYERTSTTAINAYAGRVTKNYLGDLSRLLTSHRYGGPLMVMQGYGGLLPGVEAAERSIGMLECGPAAGVIGSQALGNLLEQPNVIATDMGGTTFKVSVLQNGEIEYAREPMVDRFHYTQPKIEVVSIGAGGGSIISLEPGTNAPRVGPQSAGSRPGPVCYGLGGGEPTLTDVFMLVGYMDPDTFLRGSMKLDRENARRVFETRIAKPLGMSVEQAAFGVYRVACAQVSDLIREITVERGLDPRDFILHAFGGSCGMIAGVFGPELGVKRIVIPYTASVNCAFGMISADIVHEYSVAKVLPSSASPAEVNALYAPMIDQARKSLAAEGFSPDKMAFDWSIDLRYLRQVHEVTTLVRGVMPMDDHSLERLINDFEALYERKFGKGSAYREAGIEMTMFRLTARGLMERPELAPLPLGSSEARGALMGKRPIYVSLDNDFREADIYDFEKLEPGNVLSGPAVIHTPITTIVVQAQQTARMDGYRNIFLETV